MFDGFNSSTIKYFELIENHNDKQTFKQNEELFFEGIQQPMEELFYELSNYVSAIDFDLSINKRRCISSPYNDARFCRNRPIKEYIYIRFKVYNHSKENTIGIFFDAGKTNFKYGINIYDMNSHGMELIRKKILNNREKARRLINQFDRNRTMQLAGKSYVKDNFPNEDVVLKNWLNKRTMSFYHMEEMNPVFFERALLENMIYAYEDMKKVYFFIKEALN
jgi:uncharacterized protein (DUF2461 family)